MKTLVYRIGQLGDSIIALPALWSVRHAFPNADFTLLSNSNPNSTFVSCAQVYEKVGLFTDYIEYPVRSGWRQVYEMAKLLQTVRQRKFEVLIYLAPMLRTKNERLRDAWFFRAAGIKRLIGFEGYDVTMDASPSSPLPQLPHEADALLKRLRIGGVDTPADGTGCMDLNLGQTEALAINSWILSLPADSGRVWIGIGPGSKMPSKVWPIERYAKVVQLLIERYSVWPVVFGGHADREVGDCLIQKWGCGYNAAGCLTVRASAEALRRCLFYLGNDTGTMHLAAAVRTRCLAIFSSRDYPGSWYPYGTGHIVLRTSIDCEGCMLQVCSIRRNECLERITVSDVVNAAEAMFQSKVLPTQGAVSV